MVNICFFLESKNQVGLQTVDNPIGDLAVNAIAMKKIASNFQSSNGPPMVGFGQISGFGSMTNIL